MQDTKLKNKIMDHVQAALHENICPITSETIRLIWRDTEEGTKVREWAVEAVVCTAATQPFLAKSRELLADFVRQIASRLLHLRSKSFAGDVAALRTANHYHEEDGAVMGDKDDCVVIAHIQPTNKGK